MAKPDRKRKISPQAHSHVEEDQVPEGLDGGYRTPISGDTTPDVENFTVPFKQKNIICEQWGLQDVQPALVFTHGAGGGLDNPATRLFADGFASTKSPVVCFQGSMNLKNRTQSFSAVIDHIRDQHQQPNLGLTLGGRSMGARAAVLAAQESANVTALVLVSYPLKSAKGEVRDQILLDIPKSQNVLFVSGDNDNMCDLGQLAVVRNKMKAKSWLVVVAGADHGMSLKPKEAVESLRNKAGEVTSRWIKTYDSMPRQVSLSWDEVGGMAVYHDQFHLQTSQTGLPRLTKKATPAEGTPCQKKRRRRADDA